VSETVNLLQTFKFKITLTRSAPGSVNATLGDGAFAECSGLQLEADVREYLEGGRNDGVVRRVGRVKLVPLVLKRGMFSGGPTTTANRRAPVTTPENPAANTDLWDWLTSMVSGGEVRRYDGQIVLFNPSMTVAHATWTFERGLPIKVMGPTLNAKTGDIAIEELHIAHEGLTLKGGA
jgi:phage tail-like protein